MTSATTIPAYERMAFEVDDDVATLTLQRPEAKNALDGDMIVEVARALTWFADAAPARALVVTGAGRAFSIGGDVREYGEALAGDGDATALGKRSFDAMADVALALRRTPCPVVAAVNGQAAGAGFALALACDVRIASERAAFNFAYGRLGLTPDGALPYFLTRLVPPGRALQLLMEEPVLRAPRALELGIVDEVVPADEVVAAATTRARRLAEKAPGPVASVKRLVEASLELPLDEYLKAEREEFVAALATDDLREGVTALIGGEWPRFTGR